MPVLAVHGSGIVKMAHLVLRLKLMLKLFGSCPHEVKMMVVYHPAKVQVK
jgi:hypothetical protein